MPRIHAITQSGQSSNISVTVFRIISRLSLDEEREVSVVSHEWRPQMGHSYLWAPSFLLPSLRSLQWHAGHRGSRFIAFAADAFWALERFASLALSSRAADDSMAASSSSVSAESSCFVSMKKSLPAIGRRPGEGHRQTTRPGCLPIASDCLAKGLYHGFCFPTFAPISRENGFDHGGISPLGLL